MALHSKAVAPLDKFMAGCACVAQGTLHGVTLEPLQIASVDDLQAHLLLAQASCCFLWRTSMLGKMQCSIT